MARSGCATEPGLDSLHEAWSRYQSTPELLFIVIVVVKASGVFLTISLCIKDFNWKIKMPLTLMFFLIYHVYYTMFLFLNLYMLYILYLYAIFLNMFVHCFNIELQDVDELHFCLQVKSFMNDLENSNH